MPSPSSPFSDTSRSGTPWLGFAIVGCGAAIAPLDFAVNMAFPAMTEAFALATPDIRWVALCYVITYGSLMLFCGVLGDLLGHLRVFRWGLVLSALALAACAAAPSYGWLLAGRVLQGIGVALTLSCAPALAMGLLAAAGQAVAALMLKPLMSTGIDAVSASAVRATASFGAHLLLLWFGLGLSKLKSPLNWKSLLNTALSATVSMVIGMTLILQALKTGQANLVAIFSSIAPVLLLPLLWIVYRRKPASGA